MACWAIHSVHKPRVQFCSTEMGGSILLGSVLLCDQHNEERALKTRDPLCVLQIACEVDCAATQNISRRVRVSRLVMFFEAMILCGRERTNLFPAGLHGDLTKIDSSLQHDSMVKAWPDPEEIYLRQHILCLGMYQENFSRYNLSQ